ncbi:hypothetical protein PAPYR_7987 [Paratrimastix pyriformis]|uniref:Uncharacterized protein n=1 Tax=Paratrimastix pyriformis TaxID=342808 RepID=A0ABQ8UBL9_9EUKA|nr:hypothetical protein PAPYR_7987 [Paratrimastix pyriformis]
MMKLVAPVARKPLYGIATPHKKPPPSLARTNSSRSSSSLGGGPIHRRAQLMPLAPCPGPREIQTALVVPLPPFAPAAPQLPDPTPPPPAPASPPLPDFVDSKRLDSRDFFVISPAAEGGSHEFDIHIPPLFEEIISVSLVSYSIFSPPMRDGTPTYTFLRLNFPDITAPSPRISPVLSRGPIPASSRSDRGSASSHRSSVVLLPPIVPIVPTPSPAPLLHLLITLPIVGSTTQVEYAPERVLLPAFSHLGRFRTAHVTLTSGQGDPVSVGRISLLLRAYGKRPLEDPLAAEAIGAGGDFSDPDIHRASSRSSEDSLLVDIPPR